MGRSALIIYLEAGTPLPHPEELRKYRPLHPSGWEEIFRRACEYQDDGHLAKLIRGIRTAAQWTGPYVWNKEFILKTEEQFLLLAHMVMDGAEKFNFETTPREVQLVCERLEFARMLPEEIQHVIARWPRYVGFEEGWYHVPDRESREKI